MRRCEKSRLTVSNGEGWSYKIADEDVVPFDLGVQLRNASAAEDGKENIASDACPPWEALLLEVPSADDPLTVRLSQLQCVLLICTISPAPLRCSMGKIIWNYCACPMLPLLSQWDRSAKPVELVQPDGKFTICMQTGYWQQLSSQNKRARK